VNQLQDELGKDVEFSGKDPTDFVYNTIDDNNNKKTNTLPVNGSSFLSKRLNQIAQKEVDKNMES